jgi:hypothetical protein
MPRFDPFAHPRFVDALVTYAGQSATNLQEIRDDYRNLFAQMRDEGGSAVVNSSTNGKNFGFEITMSVEERFSAYAEAIRILDDTIVTTTRATFRSIDR